MDDAYRALETCQPGKHSPSHSQTDRAEICEHCHLKRALHGQLQGSSPPRRSHSPIDECCGGFCPDIEMPQVHAKPQHIRRQSSLCQMDLSDSIQILNDNVDDCVSERHKNQIGSSSLDDPLSTTAGIHSNHTASEATTKPSTGAHRNVDC